MSETPKEGSKVESGISEEIRHKINAEFEVLRDSELGKIQEEVDKGDESIWGRELAEATLVRKQKEYSEMDFWHRAAELLNNMQLWFPGGYYRQLLEENKRKETADQEWISAREKMIKDLDELIKAGGHESVAEGIAKKEGETEARLKILADIYLKMREKGYSRSELAK